MPAVSTILAVGAVAAAGASAIASQQAAKKQAKATQEAARKQLEAERAAALQTKEAMKDKEDAKIELGAEEESEAFLKSRSKRNRLAVGREQSAPTQTAGGSVGTGLSIGGL